MTQYSEKSVLFLSPEKRSAEPADQDFAHTPKGRKLAKLTPEAFQDAALELDEIFELAPMLKAELQKNLRVKPDTPVTIKTFAALWFGIDRAEIRMSDERHIRVLNVLKNVESSLQRHVSFDTAKSPGIGFRLLFSGLSSLAAGRVSPGDPECAVFRAEAFFAELRAAGVKPYSMPVGEPSAENLPGDVIDMFSMCSAGGEMPDGPLGLLRDYLLFLEGERWQKLNELYRTGNKAAYTDAAVTMLKNFYKAAGKCYSLSISDNSVCAQCLLCTGWSACTKANGSRPQLNQKEKAILQLTKPIAWIAKRQKNAY